MAKNNLKGWIYTANDGQDYLTAVNNEIVTQLDTGGVNPKVGGIAYDGTTVYPAWPRQWRPRQVRMTNPAGVTRYVVCFTTQAALWDANNSNPATTLNIEDSNADSTVFTKQGTLGEQTRKRHVG